jgi:hypothetical protein
MLKGYSQCCGGQSARCHAPLPHRLIPPPIKRARILVDCVVAIVISVKFYRKKICGCLARVATSCCYSPCRKIPVSRHPPIRSKKWPCAQPTNASRSDALPAFQLPASSSDVSFLPNCFTLCLERTRFSAIASRSSCQIAYEFEDDLIQSPQGSKDCREEPGISTQGGDDFVKTVSAAQMTTAWHDGDSDKGATPKTQNKGTTMARTIAGRG